MKHSACLTTITLAIIGSSVFAAVPRADKVAVVDGRPVTLTCAVEKGHDLVWIRDIVALGWGAIEAPEKGSVVLRGDGITIRFKTGDPRVAVNKLIVTAPVAPQIMAGKLMVPLDFLCGAFGYSFGTRMEAVARISTSALRPDTRPPTAKKTSPVGGSGAPKREATVSIAYLSTQTLPGTTDVARSGGNRIVGRVTFAGEPVPSIKLRLIKPDGGLITPDRTTKTDEKGQYAFNEVPHGDYRVYAYVGDNPDYFNRASATVSLTKGMEATVSDMIMGKILHPISPGADEAVALKYGRTQFECTRCDSAREYNFSVTEASSATSIISASSEKPTVSIDLSSLETGRRYVWRVTAIDANGDVLGGSPGVGSQPWAFSITQRGVTAQAPDAAPAEKAQAIYDSGRILKEQGNTAQAIAEWRKTLSKEFGQPDAKPLLGVRAESLLAIGDTQRQEGDHDAALATLNTLLKDYGQSPSMRAEALVTIGKTYHAKKDYATAYRYFKDVLKLHPDERARGRVAKQRIDDMVAAGWSIPTAEESELAGILKIYEDTAARKTEIDEAREKALQERNTAVLATLGNDPLVYTNYDQLHRLCSAQILTGDMDNARKTYEKWLVVAANELMPEDYIHRKTALHDLRREYNEVIAEATRSLRLYPQGSNMGEMRFWLAQAYDYTNQGDKAVKTYDEVADRSSGSHDFGERRYASISLLRAGIILMNASRKEEAIARFERVIKEYPGNEWSSAATDKLRVLKGEGEKAD